LLAVNDTVQKWVKKHQEDPLATGLAYMLQAINVVADKSSEEIKRTSLRVAESLRHWAVGYQILKESNDTESIDEVLKKYRAQKNNST